MADRDGRSPGVEDEKHVNETPSDTANITATVNGAGYNVAPTNEKEASPPPTSATATAATASAPPPSKPAAKPSLLKRVEGLLPDWVVKALHNKRQWKNFARVMVTFVAFTVMMVARKTLDALGQATFFGLVTMCMLMPTMPIALYMFVMVTVGVGMVIGWAWGVAGFASALHVRSASRTQAQMAQVKAGLNPQLPIALQVQNAIFHGDFLDPGASAVMGVFVFIGTYALAWMRAAKPKLTFTSIFGTIIFDMTATYGPLFPMPEYTLAKALIKPAAMAMALGLFTSIFIFPQTLNHLLLHGLVLGGLGPIQGLLKMQDVVLKTDPENHDAWGALAKKAYALRKGFAAAADGLSASSRMLQLEISRGRISAGQLGELVNKTRDLGTHAFGLASFVMMVEDRHKSVERYTNQPLPHHTTSTKQEAIENWRAEHSSGKSLGNLLPDLDASTAELRKAAEEALAGASAWLTMINDHRWKKMPANAPTMADRDAAREKLAKALAEYRSGHHWRVLNRYQTMFDANGNLIPAPEKQITGAVRGLFRCFIFTSALISFSLKLIEYLEFIRYLEASCPENKFQFPGKFVATVVANANDSTGGDNTYNLGVNETLTDNENDPHDQDSDDDDDDDNVKKTATKKKKKAYPRDPDARDPTNGFQKFGRFLVRARKALTGPNGMYALRYAVVSLALWIPAVCPSSAHFYYKNRGLWALIMSQTGLGVVAGEQFFNVVTRVVGTIIGVVWGMVIWYIGAQKGNGNAYGIAVATIFLTAPFLFLRMSAPRENMAFWILTAVTVVFTVGYSWVDLNATNAASTDAGYTLGWRRALLVIIGFAAGTIVAIFPRPLSAKTLVRQGVCKNIVAIAEVYALEVTAFERSRDEDLKESDIEERKARFRDRFLKIYGRFGVIEHHIRFASMEPAMRGRWPKEDYSDLVLVQTSMLAGSAVLAGAYSRLNSVWIQRLTDQVNAMHPSFTADCLALFTILRHSLRSGVPLPPMIPIFERLRMYRRATASRYVASRAASKLNLAGGPGNASNVSIGRDSTNRDSLKPSPLTQLSHSRPDTPSSEHDSIDAEDKVMLSSDRALWDTFNNMITWQSCHDEQFAIFATAIMALMHIVSGLNTMHSIILDLVGERELEGFDMAQERWAAMDKV